MDDLLFALFAVRVVWAFSLNSSWSCGWLPRVRLRAESWPHLIELGNVCDLLSWHWRSLSRVLPLVSLRYRLVAGLLLLHLRSALSQSRDATHALDSANHILQVTHSGVKRGLGFSELRVLVG